MRTKKPLFQWDINQKFINCTGKYIDFIFDNDPKLYRVEIEDGTCLIPDEFLQTDGKKTVYECLSDGTLTENKLTVHGRPKPPNYVYTTTEKLTFDGLVQKVDDTVNDIINRANSGEFNGTSCYSKLTNNKKTMYKKRQGNNALKQTLINIYKTHIYYGSFLFI